MLQFDSQSALGSKTSSLRVHGEGSGLANAVLGLHCFCVVERHPSPDHQPHTCANHHCRHEHRHHGKLHAPRASERASADAGGFLFVGFVHDASTSFLRSSVYERPSILHGREAVILNEKMPIRVASICLPLCTSTRFRPAGICSAPATRVVAWRLSACSADDLTICPAIRAAPLTQNRSGSYAK